MFLSVKRLRYFWFLYKREINLNAVILCVFLLTTLARVFWLRSSVSDNPLPEIEIPGADSFCPPFDVQVDGHRAIFFLETTGELCLTGRQACSVESAALTNPEMQIIVYISTIPMKADDPKLMSTAGNRRDCKLLDTLWRLPNVMVVYGDITRHLRDTLLWDHWYEKKHLNSSRYGYIHLSDAVRAALLQKNGGIYLDLDVIVLRPLHCLRNTAAYITQFNSWVENGVLTFDKGHPFLRVLMKYMYKFYRQDNRESMGPPTLGLALKHFCNVSFGTEFTHQQAYICHDGNVIQLMPSQAFYAIGFDEADTFSRPTFDDRVVDRLKNSYVSHIYKHSDKAVPLTSLYASLARKYCPTIYNQVLKYGF